MICRGLIAGLNVELLCVWAMESGRVSGAGDPWGLVAVAGSCSELGCVGGKDRVIAVWRGWAAGQAVLRVQGRAGEL